MKSIIVPKPSPKEVSYYLQLWEEREYYSLPVKALSVLFVKTYPKNTDITQILIKASSLNKFSSTNIFDIWSVAKHILSLDIDKRLRKGDLSLVNDLADVVFKNNHRRLYSFASKYCSYHQPESFPIYDRYVERVLLHFHRRDKFFQFKAIDLKDYSTFKMVLDSFQEYYGLTEFNKSELDHYLWQVGKKYFGYD